MEKLAPPEGFCDLSAAYHSDKNTVISVIGVVVDYMQPCVTARHEYMMTVKLLDPKLRDALHGSQGYTLRFFAATAAMLPQIRGVGDVLLAQRLKILSVQGQQMALSTKGVTRCFVFVNGTVPDPGFIVSYMDKIRIPFLWNGPDKATPRFSQLEEALPFSVQEYVIILRKEMKSHVEGILATKGTNAMTKRKADALTEVPVSSNNGNMPMRTSFGAKYRMIKDVHTGMYADLCVEVVKQFYRETSYSLKVELYVTDYTWNKRLLDYAPPEESGEPEPEGEDFGNGGTGQRPQPDPPNHTSYDEGNRRPPYEREGDEFGYSGTGKRPWPGPYGQMVLKVNTQNPHSTFAKEWGRHGTILLLRNVKLKAMNEDSNLEGDMWPDNHNPEKNNVRMVDATSLDHPELRMLLQRKERYLARRAELENRPKKAAGNVQRATTNELTKLQATKSDKKRANKKRKMMECATQRLPVLPEATADQDGISVKVDDPLWQTNQHIQADELYNDKSIVRVLELLDYNNDRHYMHDVKTKSIGWKIGSSGFNVPFSNTRARTLVRVVGFEPGLENFATLKLDDGSSHEGTCFDDQTPLQRWHWEFALQLEDASLDADGKPVRGPDGKPVRLVAKVFHKEAQNLLGAFINPVDLTDDSKMLAKLREKMCILWGNLEEWKLSKWTLEGGLKNKPFVCCIDEYGTDAWKGDSKAVLGMRRRFKLSDTKIM